jgi:hypothetical protein
VRVFDKKFTLDDSHACSLHTSLHVTNGIPLGWSLLLPVGAVNCVQTLKVLVTHGYSGEEAGGNVNELMVLRKVLGVGVRVRIRVG